MQYSHMIIPEIIDRFSTSIYDLESLLKVQWIVMQYSALYESFFDISYTSSSIRDKFLHPL